MWKMADMAKVARTMREADILLDADGTVFLTRRLAIEVKGFLIS